MVQRLPEDIIDPENPWDGDKLERKAVAERLTKILETSSGPLVVSVTAPFGMGKTFFAKRWQADLEQQGKPAIYFNVWETDFAADPLLPLLQVITQYVIGLDLPSDKKKDALEKVVNVTKAMGPSILRVLSKGAIKVATSGLTDGRIDTWEEMLTTASLDEIGKVALDKVNAFAKEQDARKSFKVQLKELRETLIPTKKSDSTDDKIYIFVDELDRCRPPYALEFLETVKHLFDVEGFVFILCVDEGALQNTAQQIYGASSEGEGYLRKFIDFRFQLPPPSYLATAEYLFIKYRLAEIIPENSDNILFGKFAYVSCFSKWAQLFDLTLRQQHDVFNLLNTVIRYAKQDYTVSPIPIVGLVFIKEFKPKNWLSYSNNFANFVKFYAELWQQRESTKTELPADILRNHFFTKKKYPQTPPDEHWHFIELHQQKSKFASGNNSDYMDELYSIINFSADP